MTIHDLSPWLYPEWQPGAKRVRQRTPMLLKAGLANMIITPSETIRKQAIHHFKLPASRVVAIPLAAAACFRPTPNDAPKNPYFLYVGTIEPRKNVSGLIAAWRHVRSLKRMDLILAGRLRDDFGKLEREAGLHHLEQPTDEKLAQLYTGAAAVVYPSSYEGFGLPVLEAMQCGALVVTSRDPAIGEITGTSTATAAAIRVDPSETNALAQALLAVAREPNSFHDIRQRAVKRAGSFTWAKTATQTREVYEQAARLFLTPEPPVLSGGGGGMRAASLLTYLQSKYDTTVFSFELPMHRATTTARVWRNSWRLLKRRPPLFDRFSGFEDQVRKKIEGRYQVAVIEHFWCASYAALLRAHTDLLVLDLHNVESVLAETHSHATEGMVAFAASRFAKDYERLERQFLPLFDVILVTSEDDRARVLKLCPKARVVVFPNALPDRVVPQVAEFPRVVFSGNLEYHPNIVAVQWFCQKIWPHVRAKSPKVELWLVGRNSHAVASIIAGDKSIFTTDAVEDTFPLIAQAQVCVAPILSGSGTRFKILEAWAAKRAVVSTVLGAEGLGAKHGEQILLAERAETFAVSILNCLESPAVRARLGEKGHALYSERYSWPAAWKALEAAGI